MSILNFLKITECPYCHKNIGRFISFHDDKINTHMESCEEYEKYDKECTDAMIEREKLR